MRPHASKIRKFRKHDERQERSHCHRGRSLILEHKEDADESPR